MTPPTLGVKMSNRNVKHSTILDYVSKYINMFHWSDNTKCLIQVLFNFYSSSSQSGVCEA